MDERRCGPEVRGPEEETDAGGWSVEPGALIGGSFRVVRELGHGSMGRVVLARDEQLDRDVAIKLLSSSLLLSPEEHDRLVREARAMAAIRHENVVAVYSYDESDWGPYFVMEYIPGPSLAQTLGNESRLSLDVALGIFTQVCDGVQAIHDAGAVHRDIKPANILIGPGYRIAVADLGLARLETFGPEDARVTRSLVGTPWYMAPELVVEDAITTAGARRADIYALGALAYQLLTGEVPFPGPSVPLVLKGHLSDPPTPPSERCPELPACFDDPILAALEKDPRDRPESARELRDGLLRAREQLRRPLRSVGILVADDDAVFLQYASTVLERSFPAARVQTATDGARALTLLDATANDIAVLDLDMPELNAIELTAAIRSRAPGRRPQVVIVTAAGGVEDRDVLARLQVAAFLLKPIEPKRLVETVERLLADRI